MIRHSLLPALILILSSTAFAQSTTDWIFDDSTLPEIYITINPEHLDSILTHNYSDKEYPAEFVFMREETRDTVSNIGFRIRGNTSRASQKKSFKVSFDTFEDGREYYGLDKMNINGEHNDPSIIRSKLSWDVFAALDVPAPRSNHVKLYINGDYYGLYINVEHIDNEFVDDRFGSDAGNLYKSLYPSDLTYLGENPGDYKREEHGRRIYELKTNEDVDDYTDIANFIKFLAQASDQDFEHKIRDYINVDGVLRVMAVDMLTGMWDDYMFNKNNFYLYQNPETNTFEFIPFDYDNTFGIDWFNIDWSTRNINDWGSNDNRPLTDRLFAIPKYKNRLHYYIKYLLDNHFNEQVMFPEIDRLKAMIQTAAEDDTYRTLDYGYSVEDFNNSYTQALGAHVKAGLKEYITNRHNSALQQLQLKNIHPVFQDFDWEITNSESGPVLVVFTQVMDDDSPTISTHLSGGVDGDFLMNDSGENGDEISGDGIFTTSISLASVAAPIEMFIEATDAENQSERFPFNPNQTMEISVTNATSDLVINEFMASNSSTITDETGSFPDWVELYNPTDAEISMSGYFLTDDLANQDKWAFPDTTIPSKGFLLIWVDDDEEDGPMHASFNLSKSGEDLGLYFDNGSELIAIDAFTYGAQQTDISFGREQDGEAGFIFFSSPTPGTSNNGSTSIDEEVSLPDAIQLSQNYPNPFNPTTTLSFSINQPQNITLKIYSITGTYVQTIANGFFSSGTHSMQFDASNLASGIYFYRLETETGASTSRKMSLIK
ncbi:MAG: CotH kinase family protein [Balneolaceae bacterium]|nr:CotH kinase family protein [Balneolaceae bacterium]